MKSVINKLPDATVEITVTIPWSTIQEHYRHVVDEAVAQAELAGFRKGKAPRELVEKNLDKTKLYEDVIRHIVPQAYNTAITEHTLKPLVTPTVELKEATEGKDWVLLMRTCERPKIVIGDYKKAVAEVKAGKTKKLWVPGQDSKQDKPGESAKPTLDELLSAIANVVTVTLPKLLVDTQVNRLLSDLLDQTKKLGLSVDQYLASTGRTADSVRAEYEKQARQTLIMEFALEEIADKEGVIVNDDDVDKLIATGKTDEERKALSSQRYYLSSLLRRQKTIDTVAGL